MAAPIILGALRANRREESREELISGEIRRNIRTWLTIKYYFFRDYASITFDVCGNFNVEKWELNRFVKIFIYQQWTKVFIGTIGSRLM